ncbi:putative ph domain-containing protein [Golovinomyces cichoracearum]|uniref:Putative ph domain-containing protein n=1 Tax=Golovinomyces cichoracearum TaxID=62708 RepID=A0A420IG50_9PEZI|nr:putative ph domain-containing protein [Golovinomyces cichoracearum]
MASLLAKIISKKILRESLENKFGQEDPHFETVPATRLDGTPSKNRVKKRPKALPPGISSHDAKVLTKVKRRAYRLDMCLFNFCGIRFGWSSVIGFIPAFGDILDTFMALMVYRTCQQVEGGLPNSLKMKMMINIVADFVVGLVPFLGDLADALFRANTKNAILLEHHLRDKGVRNLENQNQLPLSSGPTGNKNFGQQETKRSQIT